MKNTSCKLFRMQNDTEWFHEFILALFGQNLFLFAFQVCFSNSHGCFQYNNISVTILGASKVFTLTSHFHRISFLFNALVKLCKEVINILFFLGNCSH